MPAPSPQTGAAVLPSRADLLALAKALARLEGPSPAMDFRIAELFDLAPDPDSYSSELTPAGNGFDWRAPAFTAVNGAVRDLARYLGDAVPASDPRQPAVVSLCALVLRLAEHG